MNTLTTGVAVFGLVVGTIEGNEPPVRVFANEIASVDCVLRTFNGQPSWYHASFASRGNEVLLECQEDSDGTGFLGDSWLLVGESFSEPKELRFPGLGYFSNPSICGNRVAYWRGFESQKLEGVIAELDQGMVLAEKDLEAVPVETDFRFHFPLPMWKEGCEEVEFQTEERIINVGAYDG